MTTPINITRQPLAGRVCNTLDARDLYDRLHVPAGYPDWLWRTLDTSGLHAGTDYVIGRHETDVTLTIHAGMVISMRDDSGLPGAQLFRALVRYEEDQQGRAERVAS